MRAWGRARGSAPATTPESRREACSARDVVVEMFRHACHARASNPRACVRRGSGGKLPSRNVEEAFPSGCGGKDGPLSGIFSSDQFGFMFFFFFFSFRAWTF